MRMEGKAYASGNLSSSYVSATRSTDNKSGGAVLKKEFELLDSPGIIPAKMVDQSDALLLAACNCLGQAAYDNQAVAAYLCEWLMAIHKIGEEYITAPQWRTKCVKRYGFDPLEKSMDNGDRCKCFMTGEDMLYRVADTLCRGDQEDASRKILQDFRTGRMGPISLQIAPETETDDGQLNVPVDGNVGSGVESEEYSSEQLEKVQKERAKFALITAKERGLELPPSFVTTEKTSSDVDMQVSYSGETRKVGNNNIAANVIGKGMFDGW